LLAVILRTGKKNKSVLELAKEIIKKYRNLKELAKKDYKEVLREFKGAGFGKTKALTLLAVFEIGKRISQFSLIHEEIKIDTPEKVFHLMNVELSKLNVEKFYVITLNKRNVVTGKFEITSGVLDSSLVTVREVFKVAIDNRAASIILVHNHPSGNLEPSKDDIEITKRIYEAGKLMEIPVLDHLIIADNRYTSFADRGLVFN